MKKVSKLLLAIMMCFVSMIAITACTQPKVKSGVVKAGTLANVVVRGTQLDTSNTIVLYTFDDGKTQEVEAEDLKFSTIDTNVIGVHELTITWEEKEFNITYKVRVAASEDDVNAIIQLDSNLLKNFEANRLADETAQISFNDKTQSLYVGDDNALNFGIVASGTDAEGDLVTGLQNVTTKITVELKEGETYTLLEGADLEEICSINNVTSEIDFTEDAIGKTFRITVEAVNIDEDYEADATKFVANNIVVVDAYNVYDAKDLSVYDNVNDSWAEIKAEKGITEDDGKNGVVLLADINVTRNDVRQDIFWKREGNEAAFDRTQAKLDIGYGDEGGLQLEGSLIDASGTGIYDRSVANNGTEFNFIGNYFGVNLSEFPRMVASGADGVNEKGEGDVINIQSGEIMTSHMCVFYTSLNVKSENSDAVNAVAGTKVNWKNIAFVGNGEKSTDEEQLYLNSGSILLMKNNRINANLYNNICNNFYITYFMECGETTDDNDGNYVIDKCKAYNSANVLLYLWRAEHVLITDCEFMEASGPAIIADHVDPTNDNGGYPTRVDIVNSHIESKVAGSESWFINYDAVSIANDLKVAEQLFTGENGLGANGLGNSEKTMFADKVAEQDRLNLIAVMKADLDTQNFTGLPAAKLAGYIRMFDTHEDYNKFYATDDTHEVTTYGLDMGELQYTDETKTEATSNGSYLRDKSYGYAPYFESASSGKYISTAFGQEISQGGTDQDTTALGVLQAVGFLEVVFPKVNQRISQLGSSLTFPDGYKTANLADRRLAIQNLLTQVGSIGAIPGELPGGGESIIDQIYAEAKVAGLLIDIDSVWSTLNGNVGAKIGAIMNIINETPTESYSDGYYANIYINNGMGAIIGLYDQED